MCLVSCGARKSEVHKEQTEKTIKEKVTTNTAEAIKETVTTEIDTVITLQGKTIEAAKFLHDVVNGQPMVYEDEDVRSETYYEGNTGLLLNKTTLKPKKIPVKKKEVAQREIRRDIQQKSNVNIEESTSKKDKVTARSGITIFTWVGIFVFILLIILLIIWIWRKYRKASLV